MDRGGRGELEPRFTGSDIDPTLDDADDTKQRSTQITEQAHRRWTTGVKVDHRFGRHRRRLYGGYKTRQTTGAEQVVLFGDDDGSAVRQSTQVQLRHTSLALRASRRRWAARAGCIGPPQATVKLRESKSMLSDGDDELESRYDLSISCIQLSWVWCHRGGPGQSALHYGLARVSEDVSWLQVVGEC